MHLPNTATSLALSLALLSCGGKDQGKQDTSQAESQDVSEVPTPAESASEEATEAPTSTIHVVVSGGAHAGTYDAKASDVTCRPASFGALNAWGYDYSVRGKKPNELSSLGITVPDSVRAVQGTGTFVLSVGFGDVDEGSYSDHEINTLTIKKGSGTAKVEERGQSAKLTFKGRTPDGVGLEGTIDCQEVFGRP